MNYKVNDKDLNGIDYLNGTSSLNFKGIEPIKLTGSLSKSIYYNNPNITWLYDEWLFIQNEYNKVINFITEQWEYENLPDDLDKYILEYKILTNGIAYFIKIGNDIYIVNGSVIERDIYNRPLKIICNEESKLLNNKEFDIFGYIRNNRESQGIFRQIFRSISGMERTLFQIEKNLTSAAPKGVIINPKGEEPDTEEANSKSDIFESITNSQNTFSEISLDINQQQTLKEIMEGSNISNLFIPIELKDRTEQLLKNYTFFKENLKEIIGSAVGSINPKQERLITSETTAQQDLSDNNKAHLFNIRQNDIKNLNKKLNLNIVIKRIYTPEEEIEMRITNENTDKS